MFYTFNETNESPHDNAIQAHVVIFTPNKIVEHDFNQFMADWNICDQPGTPYYLFFDTSQLIHTPEIKYAIRIANFIKKKRKESPKHLQFSIIYVKNKTVLLLLRMVFNLTAPIAPVYIVTDNTPNFMRELTECITEERTLPKNVLKFIP